tara:strand:- start:10497 stop:11414 length:918 start_codon:yes stop_codon:yes gene_type:complete
MKAPQYPHYSKLRNILKEEQLDIYKNLTKKLSIIDSIDFNEVSIIKSSSRVLVMCYRGGIIKVIFAPNNIYKNELYFSHILYPVNIYSLASLDGCMIFLPKYGLSLNKHKYSEIIKESHILERDICRQVMQLHTSFIVHNDIKPSNIVNTKNIPKDIYSWRIIDFGLSETHILSNPGRLYFENGTRDYNIPKFRKDITNLSESEQLFWIYMKDWYGVSRTFSELKNGESNTFSELKNKEEFKLNEEFVKPIVLGDVVKVFTKQINIEIEYLYMYIDDMELSMILKVLRNLLKKHNIEETPYYLIV